MCVNYERMIYMTGSNARVLEEERKNIVMTSGGKRENGLAVQKFAGISMLAATFAATVINGELSVMAVSVPFALAAIFSKEKIMDLDLFGTSKKRCK